MTGNSAMDLLADLRWRYGSDEWIGGEFRALPSYGASRFDTLLGHGHVQRRYLSRQEREGASALYAYRLAP